MKLLAISTSSKIPSAALVLDDKTVIHCADTSGKPHSASLMPLIDALLAANGLAVSDIDIFCVDVGPGSFTGVRIGVSTVNAFARVTGKPIIAVTSLDAMRHIAPSESGTVCCMIDARNGNGYASAYTDGKCVLSPCACVQSEILDSLAGDYTLVGDCMGKTDAVDAPLIAKEAMLDLTRVTDYAVPMYLRPSQAERLRQST